MKNRLYVTVVTQVLNEEGEELLEKASNMDSDDNYGGMSKEWFIENNLKPPKELEDDIERDEDGAIILDEKHLEYSGLSYTIPINKIITWGENIDMGSDIYLQDGLKLHVFEEEFEIEAMITFLHMSWLERQKAVFNSFLRKLRWNRSKEKEQMDTILETLKVS